MLKDLFKPKKEKTFSPEYYDLPYKYNKTVVKIVQILNQF